MSAVLRGGVYCQFGWSFSSPGDVPGIDAYSDVLVTFPPGASLA